MRNIIFRGKRVDNGEWVEGYYFYKRNKYEGDKEYAFEYAVITPGVELTRGAYGETSNLIEWEVIPETVSEFTGLCDKNGKKIFEGDIVSYLGFCCEDSIGKVTFGLGTYDSGIYEYNGWIIEGTEDELDCKALTRHNIEDNNVEIIGNIHDNPELLKERESK